MLNVKKNRNCNKGKKKLGGDKCLAFFSKLSQVQSGSVANSYETCIVTRGSATVEDKRCRSRGRSGRGCTWRPATVIDSTRTLSIPPTLSLSATWTSWLHNRRDKRNPSRSACETHVQETFTSVSYYICSENTDRSVLPCETP